MGSGTKRRIRNFLIDPKAQLLHVLFTVLALTASMGVICILILIQLRESFETLSLNPEAYMQLESIKDNLIKSFACATLILCLLYGALSIALTHRVFGLLFAVEKYLERILNNESPEPIKGRKTDQGKRILKLVTQVGERFRNLNIESKKNNSKD